MKKAAVQMRLLIAGKKLRKMGLGHRRGKTLKNGVRA